MASIRKRDGKYQVRVTRQGHQPLAKTFINRTDAVRWGRQMEVALERGVMGPDARQTTLRDLIERYLANVTPTKKNAIPEGYLLKAWARRDISGQAASQVSHADLIRWRDMRIADGASGGTVRNALAALSAVYRHAINEWGYHRLENPVMRLKRPAPGRARSRRVDDRELSAIKAATGSTELPDLIDLAANTAMRLSELLSLRWANVDLHARTVLLPDTKNGDCRTVPLSTSAVRILSARRADPIMRIDGRVFTCTTHAVTIAFRRATARARARHLSQPTTNSYPSAFLVDLRFHDLRHEAVSRLFERGLNPMEVALISGHRSMQMLKRYTHLRASDLVSRLG